MPVLKVEKIGFWVGELVVEKRNTECFNKGQQLFPTTLSQTVIVVFETVKT